MHVHSAEHVAPGEHLKIFHEFFVSPLWTVNCLTPFAHRVGSAGKNLQTVNTASAGCSFAQRLELEPCRRAGRVWPGGDLDLGLQQFALQAKLRAWQLLEKSIGGFAGRTESHSIRQEIFLFDAELKSLRCRNG